MNHRGNADNTPPAGFFLRAQLVDMRNGFFNNVGGDQVTVFTDHSELYISRSGSEGV